MDNDMKIGLSILDKLTNEEIKSINELITFKEKQAKKEVLNKCRKKLDNALEKRIGDYVYAKYGEVMVMFDDIENKKE